MQGSVRELGNFLKATEAIFFKAGQEWGGGGMIKEKACALLGLAGQWLLHASGHWASQDLSPTLKAPCAVD